MPYQAAVSEGAMALFGEKYGSVVRMVRVPGYESKELCGGTHVERTGQIGSFFITYEGSIGSGIRRMEAVTGAGAVRYAQERRDLLNSVAAQLQATPNRVIEQAAGLQAQLREAGKKIDDLERRIARGETGSLAQKVQQVDGMAVLTGKTSASNMDTLREAGDHLRDQLGSGVVVLGAVIEGQPKLMAMVTQDAIERGLNAGSIIREIAGAIEGKGGGRPNLAQAGGSNAEGLEKALDMVPEVVARSLGVEG
jgi:alanyl-tRNA synthetase